MAREGKALKELFDLYLELRGGSDFIHTHYLFVSRASTMLAASKELDKEDFSRFFSEYKDCSVFDFMDALGFSEEDKLVVERATMLDCSSVIGDFANSKEYAILNNNEKFVNIYEVERKKQKKEFIRYLDGFGVDYRNEGLSIVDVGWKGSIQDNIYQILDGTVDIKGYYIGINGKTVPYCRNKKRGIMFTRFPVESKYCDYLSMQTFLTEQLLVADHGPTRGYKNGEPVLKTDEANRRIYEEVRPIQEAWIEKFKEIDKLFYYSVYHTDDFATTITIIYLNQMLKPSNIDRKLRRWMQTHASQNFGAARIKSRRLNIKGILKSFQRNIRFLDEKRALELMYMSEQVCQKIKVVWMIKFVDSIAYGYFLKKINQK